MGLLGMQDMMTVLEISAPVQADDWFLIILIVTFLLSFFSFAPRRAAFFRLADSLFKFKNPDGKVLIPRTAPLEFVLQSLLSCLSVSLFLTVSENGRILSGSSIWLPFLRNFGYVASVFIIKLVLYQSVNTWLYRKQSTAVKPTRWNGFFVSVFFVAGIAALLLCIVTVFFTIPYNIVPLLYLLFILLLEMGLAFKIKTAIFRNKCTILSFFLYLCALELGPLVLPAFLWGNLIS